VCLLGEFPYFAQAFPNPKASAAILRAFSRLAGVELDLGALDAQAREVEGQLVALQARTRELAERVQGEGGLPAASPDEEREARPDPATRARVEALFDAARSDRGKALELKAELDRLGLFKEYEDRFLDLFKRGE
jgi:hypothetical protein